MEQAPVQQKRLSYLKTGALLLVTLVNFALLGKGDFWPSLLLMVAIVFIGCSSFFFD